MSQYLEQDYKATCDKRLHRASMIHDSKLRYDLSHRISNKSNMIESSEWIATHGSSHGIVSSANYNQESTVKYHEKQPSPSKTSFVR